MALSSFFTQAACVGLKLAPLTYADLDGFMALQDRVLARLSPSSRHHLKPRNRADLEAHLEAGMPILGVFAAQTIVGQLILSDPQSHAARHLEGYLLEKGNPAIIQAVAIDPAYRGSPVSEALLSFAACLGHIGGHSHLLAKVAESNAASLRCFARAAFTVAARGVDPEKAYPVVYLHKRLTHAPQHRLSLPPAPAAA